MTWMQLFWTRVSNSQNAVWLTQIQVNQIDTGAEVTAISMDTYRHLKKPQLTTASKVLYGPSRIKLKVKGMLVASISREDVTTKQPIFVVDGICFESCGQVRRHCRRTKRHPSYGDNYYTEIPICFSIQCL